MAVFFSVSERSDAGVVRPYEGSGKSKGKKEKDKKISFPPPPPHQLRLMNTRRWPCGINRELISTRVFETRTATGRGHSVCQDSGVSHIFILIIQNREMVLSMLNVMV